MRIDDCREVLFIFYEPYLAIALKYSITPIHYFYQLLSYLITELEKCEEKNFIIKVDYFLGSVMMFSSLFSSLKYPFDYHPKLLD